MDKHLEMLGHQRGREMENPRDRADGDDLRLINQEVEDMQTGGIAQGLKGCGEGSVHFGEKLAFCAYLWFSEHSRSYKQMLKHLISKAYAPFLNLSKFSFLFMTLP